MKSLEKRIEENLMTKAGTLRVSAKYGLNLIQNPTQRVHSCFWGRGYASLIDISPNIIAVLESLNIDYKIGNDAPRGGQTGKYIELTTKGKRQVAKYNSKRIADNIQLKLEAEKIASQLELEAKERSEAEKLHRESWLKDFKENGNGNILEAWKLEKCFHPAPAMVLKLKIESGMSWNEFKSNI